MPEQTKPSSNPEVKGMRTENAWNRHPLIQSFRSLSGNPRACLITEPLFGIPYNLVLPFFSLFMASLGVTDQQIGFRLTLGMLIQMPMAFLGGAITDKLGRHRTTFYFDLIAWGIPPIIYVFAQDYRYFIVGVILNAVFQVTMVSWNCLLVEDAPPKELVNIFTWVTLSGLAAVFFSPLASLLVAKVGLDLGARILMANFAIFMIVKVWLTYRWTTETTIGKQRLEQTRDVPFSQLLKGYGDVAKRLLQETNTRVVLAFMVLTSVIMAVNSNFFALYAIQNLGLPEYYAGFFPILRALIMIFFIFTVQTKLNGLPFKRPMNVGIVLGIISQVCLLFAGRAPLVFVILYVIFDAFAYALIIPQKDGLGARVLDPIERARSLSLIQMISQGVTAPFLSLVGSLSQANRLYSFVLNIVAFAICFILTQRYGDRLEDATPLGVEPVPGTEGI